MSGVSNDTAHGSPAQVADRPLRVLEWARLASGDVWLRPWRLTPERLAAYAAAVRAVVGGGPAVDVEDPAALLDPARQPLLRPWAYEGVPPGFDPARAVAHDLARYPGLARAITSGMPLEEFAAAHLRVHAGAWVLVRLFGTLAEDLTGDDLRRWTAAARPRPGAEEDFAAGLVTISDARAHVDPGFLGI